MTLISSSATDDFSEQMQRPPALDEVLVALVSLSAGDPEVLQCEQLLSRDELLRANRFVLPAVRRRFVVCRARLRQWLGKVLNTPPQQLRFAYGKWGKPELAVSPVPRLEFSVSHSGDWGVIALARAAVGIDLEIAERPFDYRSIATQVLSPSEQLCFEQLPIAKRDQEMLRLWVCKEAILKAMGLGVAEGLRQVSLPIPMPEEAEFEPVAIDPNLQMHVDEDGSCRRVHWTDPQSWRLRLLSLLPASQAALAVPAAVRHVRVHSDPTFK